MTRFIPSEEIDEQQVRHWHFGGVRNGTFNKGFAAMPEMTSDPALLPLAEEPVAQPQPEELEAAPVPELELDDVPLPVPGISEEELRQQLEQARQEAYAQGLEQGRQQAAQEWQARMADYQNNLGRETAQRLNEVLHAAQTGVQGLQQQMAPDLLQLAVDIARQVVRQELRCNPQALQPVVAEALDMLGADTKPAVVRLNPEDFQQLQAHLRAALPNPKVEWLSDPTVAKGGCLVESQGAQIDGSLERRWQRAVAALGLVSTWYDGGAGHGN
ncbi:FliH/SctL family protein [Comamonas aquatica]|uniref:Flagellar assembly protein FliH n=1 Tax=Comamonas aquatica TaxID=225991 RepID=A0AA42W5P7_9BURK|nr:FliH/SctL family protein [Comamonas aquatica]MDH0901005.1 FliH/SctL family protein [Comamonas aquatica]MDH1427112.1 FliH/SctL family protein [Comamonas aquatica]MDH1607160.1 FliH/SctL family protein [Comamonas aquatica]MDH1618965.1 FliH/SctL family protein [Comamonas aquatica]MDH2006933.1 FliH/SctL family protein [Comamonas aquatica]